MLVDRSLVRLDENGHYDLHELLRQYAEEALVEQALSTEVRDAHLAWAADLAGRIERSAGLGSATGYRRPPPGPLNKLVSWCRCGSSRRCGMR